MMARNVSATMYRLVGILALALAPGLPACGSDGTASLDGAGVDASFEVGDDAALPEQTAPDTTPEEAADAGPEVAIVAPGLAEDLIFLREEEKLARDVYLHLFDTWGLAVHKNIAASEQTHTDRVRDLLATLEVADPVASDAVGAFTNPDLAGLYAALTAEGDASEVAALTVGATIEDLDIADITHMIARTDDARALALYEGLRCGSRNHMRSFAGQLQAQDQVYEAQYIEADDLAAILAGGHETCALP